MKTRYLTKKRKIELLLNAISELRNPYSTDYICNSWYWWSYRDKMDKWFNTQWESVPEKFKGEHWVTTKPQIGDAWWGITLITPSAVVDEIVQLKIGYCKWLVGQLGSGVFDDELSE